MKSRLLIAAALAGSAILSGACGRTATQNQVTEVPSASNRAPITVQVSNSHQQDIDVFVAQGSDRWRLGTVTSAQTQQFTVPDAATHAGSQIRLVIHPIGGGGDYSTGAVTVAPGDEVDITVAASLNQTSFSVSQR